MADDYYQVLGVGKNASQADIQKAYRTLARKYHPDLHPDDKSAKEKFQKVQAAFDVLNDSSKRELYDRYGSAFESAAAGAGGAGPRGGQSWHGQGGPQGGYGEIDLGQFFDERFGQSGGSPFVDLFGGFQRAAQSAGRKGRGRAAEQPGADVQSTVEVPFQTAIQGGKVELGLQRPGGKIERIDVKIPPGISDGAKIRLRGQGSPGQGKAPAGDLLLSVHVATHPYYQRRGNDLIVRVPITLAEAVAGAKVDIPTPNGAISLRIPPHTSGGARLRIRGHGLKLKDETAGDLYAEVQIMLPTTIDNATAEAIRKLDEQHPMNPRRDLRW